MQSDVDKKSGKQVASGLPRGFAKNDVWYWLEKVFKPVNGDDVEGPHYCLRVQFKGRRLAFTTGVGNKDAAARTARDIYVSLVTVGIEATLARWRTEKADPNKTPDGISTVGQYIEAARKVMTASASTLGSYERCLRTIVADILNVAKSKKRFHHGNAANYRAEIDKTSLSVLTPESIQKWRVGCQKKADDNPAAQKRARISCNSVLRQARSLFGKKVSQFISGVTLPDPAPFSLVEFFPRESMRYKSKIDAAKLLQQACEELEEQDPEAFKAFLLALGAGLRKREIDTLTREQINFVAGKISVEITEHADLKSSDSEEVVTIDPELCAMLKKLCDKTGGRFVLKGDEDVKTDASYGKRYRCTNVFERLYAWLLAHGVPGPKPLHTLRKEGGSLVCAEAGIYAASRFLRHADTQVTAQHYVDNKKDVTVRLGALLKTTPEDSAKAEPSAPPPHKESNSGSSLRSSRRKSTPK